MSLKDLVYSIFNRFRGQTKYIWIYFGNKTFLTNLYISVLFWDILVVIIVQSSDMTFVL